MRAIAIVLAIVGGVGAASMAGRAEACSIRGNYCGYPSWAANAFEGRFGYKGDYRALTDYYPGFGSRKAVAAEPRHHRKRRH